MGNNLNKLHFQERMRPTQRLCHYLGLTPGKDAAAGCDTYQFHSQIATGTPSAQVNFSQATISSIGLRDFAPGSTAG